MGAPRDAHRSFQERQMRSRAQSPTQPHRRAASIVARHDVWKVDDKNPTTMIFIRYESVTTVFTDSRQFVTDREPTWRTSSQNQQARHGIEVLTKIHAQSRRSILLGWHHASIFHRPVANSMAIFQTCFPVCHGCLVKASCDFHDVVAVGA